nr:vegetative cell wall protein gp1-like [Aegilops tauschii subsp. strangulata]
MSSPPSPSLPLTTTAAAASSPIATGPLALPSAPLDLISDASTGLLPPPVSTTPPAPSTLPAQYSPEAMAGVLNDLVVAVQGIRLYLASSYGPSPPLPPPVPSGPPALPWYAVPAALAGGYPTLPPPSAPAPAWPQWPAPAPAALPTAAAPAPAPWPPWPAPVPSAPAVPAHTAAAAAPAPAPWPVWPAPVPSAPAAPAHTPSPPPSAGLIYTEAGDPPVPTLQSGASSGSAGAYDGLSTVDRAPSSSLQCTAEPVGHGAPTQTPPRFAKIDFATYDGTEDPLNWLNQCEQFFRGQRTLASERTWLASYHLRGAAQTWYYALEQDEGGMPPWERFRELCLLRFGPPIRGSRLARS